MRMSRARAIVWSAGVVVSVGGGVAAAGSVTSHWLGPTSGLWTDATRWSTSPFYPQNDNPSGETYHAVVDAPGGAPYTITMQSDVALDALTVDSEQASVWFRSSEVDVDEVLVSAGEVRVEFCDIRHGEWTQDGGRIVFQDGVHIFGTKVFGDILLDSPNASVQLRSNASISGDITIATDGGLVFRQNSSVKSGQTINFDNVWGSAGIRIAGVHTLTIDPGARIRGRGTIWDDVLQTEFVALVNRGVIESDSEFVVNTDIRIQVGDFVNEGTLRAADQTFIDVAIRGTAPFENNGLCEASATGTIRFRTGVVNGDGGAMRIELAGTVEDGSFTEFGRFWLYGPSELYGEDIEVALIDGFEPGWGDSFSVFQTLEDGVLTGDLSGISFPPLGDSSMRWWVAQSAASATIGVSHVADINHDGVVGFADLNIVLSGYSGPGVWEEGDADGDGQVGFADLNLVLGAFGSAAE